MRVAAAQAVAVAGDVAANTVTAARLVDAAGAAGAALLVLPEAFLCGYDEHVFARGGFVAQDDVDGAWLDPLRDAVTRAGLVLVLAHPVARAHGDVLSMLVLRPDGTITAPYDKQHLDADERAWFVPGERSVLLDVDGLRVAPAICSDVGEPGHAAAAAAAGAEAYAVSAAWFAGSEERRDETLRRRSVDHGLPVVHAGATGPSDGPRGPRRTVGGSAVLAADGTVLARLGPEEGLAVADL